MASALHDSILDAPAVTFTEYAELARVARERQQFATATHANHRPRQSSTLKFLMSRKYVLPVLQTMRITPTSSSGEDFQLSDIDSNLGAATELSSQLLRQRLSSTSDPTLDRTMSWPSVFCLIVSVCSISSNRLPLFAEVGFGLGISLTLVFGAFSYFSSWLLWQMFQGLDSFQYPVKTYADLADRIYGKWPRYIIITVQTFDLLSITGQLILAGGSEILTVMPGGKTLCYPTSCVIVAVMMMLLGEIRTLRSFSWIALSSFLITIIQLGITLGTSGLVNVSKRLAFETLGFSLGPIKASFSYPAQDIYPKDGSYPPWLYALSTVQDNFWGNIIFTELMSEMKNISDFGIALNLAWLWLLFQSLLFGIVGYANQGQYLSFDPFITGYWGLNDEYKTLLTMCSILNLLYVLIYGALMANVALKIISRAALRKFGRNFVWTTKRVKVWWCVSMPLYWSFTFVLAMCVPFSQQWQGIYLKLGYLFAAYGLPAILYIGYHAKMYQTLYRIRYPTADIQADELGTISSVSWIASVKQTMFLGLVAVTILVALAVSTFGLWFSISQSEFNGSNIAPLIWSC